MTDTHHITSNRPIKRYALATAKIIAIGLGLAVLTHVSWNMFAPDLFGAPDLRMKQALGMVMFAGLVGFLVRVGAGHRRHD